MINNRFRKRLLMVPLVFAVGCEGGGGGGGSASVDPTILLTVGVGMVAYGVFGQPTNTDKINQTTRMFGGRGQFDPGNYAAYGILAFPTDPTERTRDRFEMFCEAFATGLDPIEEDTAPANEQAITIWPIKVAATDARYEIDLQDACAIATIEYDARTARQAIAAARSAGRTLKGAGPFLIATAPGSAFPPDNTRTDLLTLNLSDHTTASAADNAMQLWSSGLRTDPSTWEELEDEMRSRTKVDDILIEFGDVLESVVPINE